MAPKVVETLLALIERRSEIVSKDEMMKRLWSDSFVDEGNLTQYIYLLRKTLGNGNDGRPMIETFRRRGYCFNGEVVVAYSHPRKGIYISLLRKSLHKSVKTGFTSFCGSTEKISAACPCEKGAVFVNDFQIAWLSTKGSIPRIGWKDTLVSVANNHLPG